MAREADLGVSAHRDHLEARYAHRTRLLDYLWAGLPVVATRGDALAELVDRERLGRGRARRRRRLSRPRARGCSADGRAPASGSPRSRRACAGRASPRRSSPGAPAPPPRRPSAAESCAAPRSRSTAGRSRETLGDEGPVRAHRGAPRRWPGAVRRGVPPRRTASRARLGLDRVELAVLAALAGLSLVVLAALLTKGRALTGADGLLASDQLQYFTWIRQAGEHG